MRGSSRGGPTPRERLAAAWREPGGATRTQPILVASVCAGVIGYTLASALQLNVLLSYAITVVVVFVVATLVLAWR
jgi:hypothetical protein